MSPLDQTLLSIITVVRNAPEDFETTLSSVLIQDLEHVEYLVVDSSDDPSHIAEQVRDLPVKYSWTPAQGIYPAMNFGLGQARGDYVYFLNAGDALCDSNVLWDVCSLLLEKEPIWMFADVQMSDCTGIFIPSAGWSYRQEEGLLFSRGKFPCHQGTFARRESLLAIGGFDTNFRIVADYLAMLKLSRVSRPLRTSRIVATFQPDGTSSQHWLIAMREFHQARRQVFQPTGATALRENGETLLLLLKTGLYRSLWARGRIGYPVVSRLRRLLRSAQSPSL